MKKEEIKALIMENIATETPLRVWKRRLLVALTPKEVQKCKYHIVHLTFNK